MPPGSTQYTIAGFCPKLDWRPLSFVKSIPPHRVCTACGLVRKRIALLPCMHTLCESCYAQSAQEGSHICPHDGYKCHDEDDVDWKEFLPENLLRREVKCWNADSGCRHVGPASMIAQHFQRDCVHHSTCCPKCSIRVLYSEMWTHIRSGSCGSLPKPSFAFQKLPELNDENAFHATSTEAIENKAAKTEGSLQKISVGVGTHGDRLNDIPDDVSTFNRALREELTTVTTVKGAPDGLKEMSFEVSAPNAGPRGCFTARSADVHRISTAINPVEKVIKEELLNVTTKTADHLSPLVAVLEEVKTEGRENFLKILECVTTVLQLTRLQTTRCEVFVEGVKSLTEKALKEGFAVYVNERVYMRGYCMSPALLFRRDGDSVRVFILLQLHKGDMDGDVQWPFAHKIMPRIFHPKEATVREAVVGTSRTIDCERPKNPSNGVLYFPQESFDLGELLNSGFVEDDKLRVMWQLLL